MKLIHGLAVVGLSGALMLTAPAAQAAIPARPSEAPVQRILGGDTSAQDAKLSKQDRQFLVEAHEGNLAEIAAGRLAVRKGRCQAVDDIARELVKAHSRLDALVQRVAKRFDVRLPDTPNADQREALQRLAALSESEFDRAWLRTLIAAHRNALELVEQQLEEGRSRAVKELAREGHPVIKQHLSLLRETRDDC